MNNTQTQLKKNSVKRVLAEAKKISTNKNNDNSSSEFIRSDLTKSLIQTYDVSELTANEWIRGVEDDKKIFPVPDCPFLSYRLENKTSEFEIRQSALAEAWIRSDEDRKFRRSLIR